MTDGFLSDGNGSKSSMRLMNMLSLFASFGMGFITLLHPQASQNPNGLYLTVLFALGAFAPKAVQKFMETKLKV